VNNTGSVWPTKWLENNKRLSRLPEAPWICPRKTTRYRSKVARRSNDELIDDAADAGMDQIILMFQTGTWPTSRYCRSIEPVDTKALPLASGPGTAKTGSPL
jgi:hypothetical protein